jgi:hypothetical protein
VNFIIHASSSMRLNIRTIRSTSRTAALRLALATDGHGDVAVPRGARFLKTGETRYEVIGVEDSGGNFYPHENAMRTAHRRDRERR